MQRTHGNSGTHMHCRQAMCRCTMGTTANIAQRGEDFQRNAKLTFQMWQNQGQLHPLSAQPSGDIPIPQLLRKSITEPPAVLAAPGFIDRRSAAERALQMAREVAHHAVTRAAYLAGAAGLDYSAPAGFPVDLSNIPKRDTRALEARVRAAEQALATRHAQNLNRIHSMDALPTLASLPELQARRHSMPAGADATQRRSRPPPQRAPAQQEPAPDDAAAADLNSLSASPKAVHRSQRVQNRSADAPPAKMGASAGQRPRIRSNALRAKAGSACQQPKARQRAEPSGAGPEGGDAWEAAPGKPLRLRVKDVRNTLKERWLQLFWPEDGRWWPGRVLDIRCKERKVHLLYKTGEEETDLDLGELIKKGEVAWLSAEEMMRASETAQTGPREGSAQQDALADRDPPAESPRQRKRALDAPQYADARTPLRHPASFTEALAPALPYGHGGAQNGALPLGTPEDYEEMDPFKHWEQVQEQQRQRQLQHSSRSDVSLLPM